MAKRKKRRRAKRQTKQTIDRIESVLVQHGYGGPVDTDPAGGGTWFYDQMPGDPDAMEVQEDAFETLRASGWGVVDAHGTLGRRDTDVTVLFEGNQALIEVHGRTGKNPTVEIEPEEGYVITFDYYGDDVRSLPFHAGELHNVIPQSIETAEGIVEDAYATIVGGAGGWEMPQVMKALLENEDVGDSITVMDWERNIIIDDDWDAVREIASGA